MSDATDDLELAEFFGTSTPVRDMDGTWYTYVYNGEKYRFRTVQEANEWARSNGFSLTTQPTNSIDKQKREAEFKRDWINQHDKADQIACDAETKQPAFAIYYYPPTKHVQDMKHIWKVIGAQMELERLEEMELYDE